LGEESSDVFQLLLEGLSSKPRLLELKRNAASLRGSQGQNQAEIAKAEQAISAAKLQMLDLRNQQMNDVVAQLRDVETQLSDLEEKLRSAAHDLEETELRAPKAGVVVGSTVHNVGGVISPGELIMEIVPDNEQLIVEARIQPQDIEHVKEGQPASVRLIGFNRRVTPSVDGKVTYVSADSLTDRASNTPYYLAKIEVDLKAKRDTADLQLQPGMPTQVMVITGERTVIDYILSPITDGIARALRES
jgi:membrane fusion protein, epimerase transport system